MEIGASVSDRQALHLQSFDTLGKRVDLRYNNRVNCYPPKQEGDRNGEHNDQPMVVKDPKDSTEWWKNHEG